MVRGREWTGFEAAALQEAMRKSVRDFASLLGLETTTVNNWRTGLSSVTPRSNTQAILDTTLDLRATDDDRARFEQIVREGEAVWRARHQPSVRHMVATGDADIRSMPSAGVVHDDSVESGSAPANPGVSNEMITVLGRIHNLSRSINPDVISLLQSSTAQSIAQYETIDPSELVPALRKQRAWLDELLDECSHPRQRKQLYEIASRTSGLLGYIAVGGGNFPLARAYCLESFHLGDHAQDVNLMAWARGTQSFCEYYAGEYDRALHYAEDGLAHADGGPQSVRLAVNGVARAAGKLGDTDGVQRAIDQAYELIERNGVPTGVPSSISLESYSRAQAAGNAATAYLSLARPDKVEQYVELALPEMNDTNSPWGRSLVMIDLARSHILAEDADLDAATGIMLKALDVSPGKPMMQVRRRGSEFVHDAATRWGDTSQLRAVHEALASVKSLDLQHG